MGSSHFGNFFSRPRPHLSDQMYNFNESLPQSSHLDLNRNRNEHNGTKNYTYIDEKSHSGYYSDYQLENSKQLQASGRLKEASWIVVPPFPEFSAIHLRTGRAHDFKLSLRDGLLYNYRINESLKKVGF